MNWLAFFIVMSIGLLVAGIGTYFVVKQLNRETLEMAKNYEFKLELPALIQLSTSNLSDKVGKDAVLARYAACGKLEEAYTYGQITTMVSPAIHVEWWLEHKDLHKDSAGYIQTILGLYPIWLDNTPIK